MSRAARSLLVFGVFVIVTGITLAIMPNTMLGLVGMPPAADHWIRVLGIVMSTVGAYYIAAARAEQTAFIRATVWGRAIVLLAFIVLVALNLVPPMLIAFAVLDAIGALWTRVALQADSHAASLARK